MKRQNYFQTHKNKRPKRLKKRKLNLLAIKSIVITMQALAQNAIVCATQFKSVAEKTLNIVQNTVNHAEAISSLYKTERKYKYLTK